MMDKMRAPTRAFVIYTVPALVFFLAVLLLLTFLSLLIGIRAGVQIGDALLHPNPFAAYETLWPGQTVSNWMAYQYRLPEGTCNGPALLVRDVLQTGQCTYPLGEALFRGFTIQMKNGRIQTLMLYSENLSESTVLLYWGAPDSIGMSANDQQRVLHWERSTYTATAFVTRDEAIVNSVTLVARP